MGTGVRVRDMCVSLASTAGKQAHLHVRVVVDEAPGVCEEVCHAPAALDHDHGRAGVDGLLHDIQGDGSSLDNKQERVNSVGVIEDLDTLLAAATDLLQRILVLQLVI